MQIPVLPGDGIGPEIAAVTVQVLERLDRRFALDLRFDVHEVGAASLKRSGSTLPEAVVAACRAAAGFILGPVSHLDYPPRAQGGLNPSGDLRIALDLYANVRPSRSYEGLAHWGRTPMDLVIVRENTEGFYADRNMHQGIGEFMPTPDLALSVRKISALASRRIAQAAFRLARRRRRKVTAVHKVNVLKVTEGLFLREVRSVAQEYQDVAYDEQLVDSMAALLVRDAARFDVIVTTNMYGDILSDEAAELSGSLGLAGSINAGRRPLHGPGAARVGTRHRRQGRGQPVRTAALGRDASRLAGREARCGQASARAGGTRGGARLPDARAGDPHPGSRRDAGHEGVRCRAARKTRRLILAREEER